MGEKWIWMALSIAGGILIGIIGIICLYFLLGNGESVKSILDLASGGGPRIRWTLQVNTDEALNQELLQDAARIGEELKAKGISFEASKKSGDYSFDIVGADPAAIVEKAFQGLTTEAE